MQAFVKHRDLLPGDYFVVDAMYEGSLGQVTRVGEVNGPAVSIWYDELPGNRPMEGTFNAEQITKYLRTGETDARLNAGRG
jgi:hypothetical protein